MPEHAVQEVFRGPVDLGEIHRRARQGVGPEQRIGDGGRIRVHLVKRHRHRHGLERGQVWSIGEAVDHRRSAGVEQVHRREAKNLADCPQHARGVVLSTHSLPATGVGARHVRRGAIAADVIPACLGIVFDREDRHLRPESAVAERLHDSSEGQIVVGHAGGRRGASRGGAARVVLRQADDHEVWVFTLTLELREFADDEVGPKLVGHAHVPANRVERRMRPERLDRRLGGDDHVRLVGARPPGCIAAGKARVPLPGRIPPPYPRHHEFTVVAERAAAAEA